MTLLITQVVMGLRCHGEPARWTDLQPL